ncbi:hypothetical protein FRX31_011601, partial [Thalictrum thalictroides]
KYYSTEKIRFENCQGTFLSNVIGTYYKKKCACFGGGLIRGKERKRDVMTGGVLQ